MSAKVVCKWEGYLLLDAKSQIGDTCEEIYEMSLRFAKSNAKY